MGRLEGKVAFITGGARGMGRAIATKFAREGADIAICDLRRGIDTIPYELSSADDLEETAVLVRRLDRVCLITVADVRDQAALDIAVSESLGTFGKIDIVVANAGVINYKPLWEITDQEWEDVIGVNLTGAWHTVKAVTPHLIERMAGCVVFTSSGSGVEAIVNTAHYVAAKHGVIGLMKATALELGPYNIRANAVLPGPVDTKINDNPAGRDRGVGRQGATREEWLDAVRHWHILRGRSALPPEAVADAVAWLASDEAQHITGVQLPVDAGHLIIPGYNPNPVLSS